MKTFAYLFLLFGFASLGLAAEKARESQTDDIREAVFRWQFDHNASGQQTNSQVYFLEVGEKGGDPTDEFMKRFANHKPPVRKVSACSANAGKGVLDMKTGEKGLIFRITRFLVPRNLFILSQVSRGEFGIGDQLVDVAKDLIE